MFHPTRTENTFQDVAATFLRFRNDRAAVGYGQPSPSIPPESCWCPETVEGTTPGESKLNSSVSFDDKPARTAHRVKRTPTTALGVVDLNPGTAHFVIHPVT